MSNYFQVNILIIVAILLSLILSSEAISQPTTKDRIIHMNAVVDRLMSAERIERMNQAYDYTAVLLLDSSLTEIIEKTGYTDFVEFRDYAGGLKGSEPVVRLTTDKSNSAEIFQDEAILIEVLRLLSEAEDSPNQLQTFVFPVYVTDKKVVFETVNPSGSDIYFGTLENGVFRILYLGGTIE